MSGVEGPLSSSGITCASGLRSCGTASRRCTSFFSQQAASTISRHGPVDEIPIYWYRIPCGDIKRSQQDCILNRHNDINMAVPPNEQLDNPRTQRGAPIHSVASRRIVSIEHPAVIKNFTRGFKSLGGEAQIKHVSGSNSEDANSISCNGRSLSITSATPGSAASKMDCQSPWSASPCGPMTLWPRGFHPPESRPEMYW